MADKKEPEVSFEDLKKEMDAFFADFEKKLKAMKIDPKVTKDAKAAFEVDYKKLLLDPMKKTYKANPIPVPKLKPAAKKCKKPTWLHIKAAPAMPPNLANGVKFTIGSKNISAGIKLKWDPIKQKMKFEPTAGLTIKFP